MNLYTQIISFPSLLYGFYRVKDSDGAAGIDNISIDTFEEDIQKNISKLNHELQSGRYHPLPLLAFEKKIKNSSVSFLKDEHSKIRLLVISAVRDRVIQASVLNTLEPIIDSELENETFAYRKGFSRESAARRINNLFNQGYCWLLDADIRNFFYSVNHSILFKRLSSIINEQKTLDLIKMWVQSEYILNNKKFKQTVGLPLGLVISPILANLYLDKFDEEISKRGFHLVRFADDFVILTKTKSQAFDALKLTQELLSELKLELNSDKTAITSFSDGFKYLGYIFVNSIIVPASSKDKSKPIPFSTNQEALIEIDRFKKVTALNNEAKKFTKKLEATDIGKVFLSAIEKKGITVASFISALRNNELEPNNTNLEIKTDVDAETPEAKPEDVNDKKKPDLLLNTEGYTFSFKRTLYIHTQGAELKKESERLIVTKKDLILIDIPIIRISQILIFGSCSITPASMQFCLRNNIPILLLSSSGKFYGKIESTIDRNIELERLQYFTNVDENFTLTTSKACIKSKINNTRVLLQRVNKRRHDSDIDNVINKMNIILGSVDDAKSIDQLRGLEGSASALYFSVFGKSFLPNTGFYTKDFKRIKHPAVDPINSLLSFGYTLFSANIYSIISALNLNPFVGFFHTLKRGHPALASDLIEEFRHVIDSLVIQVINKQIITKKDFYFVKDPDTPCLLTNNGRKEFIRQFEIKINKITTHTPSGKKADYRRCIFLQVQQYANVLKAAKPFYEPFRIKL